MLLSSTFSDPTSKEKFNTTPTGKCTKRKKYQKSSNKTSPPFQSTSNTAPSSTKKCSIRQNGPKQRTTKQSTEKSGPISSGRKNQKDFNENTTRLADFSPPPHQRSTMNLRIVRTKTHHQKRKRPKEEMTYFRMRALS